MVEATMKITKQAKRDAKGLFQSCRVNGLLEEGRVRQAMNAVVSQKPRGYLAILVYLQRLVKLDLERRNARVESAVPLTAAQQAEVAAGLARRYGAGLSIGYSQNPALIGGMTIRIGSDVYDATLQGRLNALAEKF